MPTFYCVIPDEFCHDPLSVEGSRKNGGRWNPKGMGVLYTTSSPELALMEVLVHNEADCFDDLPTYWTFTLDVPNNIRYVHRHQLPDFWRDETYERTQHWLTDWLKHPDTLGVAIPSVLVPLSCNIILHPEHPLFNQVRVVAREEQPVDKRLFRG